MHTQIVQATDREIVSAARFLADQLERLERLSVYKVMHASACGSFNPCDGSARDDARATCQTGKRSRNAPC